MNAHVTLLEGFQGDLVILAVDGREAARLSGATTKLLLGYAATAVLGVPESGGEMTLTLPRRGISGRLRLDPKQGSHIGASISGNGVTWIVSKVPLAFA